MAAELPRPESTSGDSNATEMVRVWLAHNSLQVAMRLGMWSEAGIDEREAWGYLLADIIRNVSQGLAVQCNWDMTETSNRILAALFRHMQNDRPSTQGQFVDRV
jgi:hypothetical protein